MVFNILFFILLLNNVLLLLNTLLNLSQHIILPLLYPIILIISLMNQDVDLRIRILLINKLVNIDEILDRFFIRLLLDIDEVNDAFGVDQLFKVFRLGFVDVDLKVSWEIVEV